MRRSWKDALFVLTMASGSTEPIFQLFTYVWRKLSFSSCLLCVCVCCYYRLPWTLFNACRTILCDDQAVCGWIENDTRSAITAAVECPYARTHRRAMAKIDNGILRLRTYTSFEELYAYGTENVHSLCFTQMTDVCVFASMYEDVYVCVTDECHCRLLRLKDRFFARVVRSP